MSFNDLIDGIVYDCVVELEWVLVIAKRAIRDIAAREEGMANSVPRSIDLRASAHEALVEWYSTR